MVSTDGLTALLRKYRALAALRVRRDTAGGTAVTRAELRVLAAEFPGCLRELDTLGRPEIDRRAAACAAAIDGAAQETWMAWIDGYHALMRRALAIRAAAGHEDENPGRVPEPSRDGVGSASRADSARPAAGSGDDDGDDAFAAAVRRPPGGRVGVVVLRALAAELGVPADTIARALFPLRRPSPYEL